MPDDHILIERDPPLAWLVLDRPEKLNAINADMWRAIPEWLAPLEEDPDIRVILVRGAGTQAFSAGADVAEMAEHLQSEDESAVQSGDTERALVALANCAKPTVGVIRGRCMGGGCAIALATDIRIASTDASFALTPIRLGVGYPQAGVERAVQELGPATARFLFLTASHIGAKHALDLGLVQDLQEPEDLFEAAAQVGRAIAHGAPLTVRAIRESVRQSLLPESLRSHAKVQQHIRACFESEDYREGVRAFMEKREPRFRGR